VLQALETPEVCRLAGVKPATLDYWTRTGLVRPSVRGSSGRRVTRLWSVTDVLTVRTVKTLRDAGCPLQKVREARRLIESKWADDSGKVVLLWDNVDDVLALLPSGALISTIRKPAQSVLHVVAVPLSKWQAEVEELAGRRQSQGAPRQGQRQARGA
jgi:DNA-binding transcriptional MerR regulator